MTNKKVDFIIVGQGIVGTLLAFFLLKENKNILVIDKNIPGASSLHASGIINPITGRRFAKSWLIDTLLPFAKETYKELEVVLNKKLIHEIEFCKLINSTKDDNDLAADMGVSDYLPYFPVQEKTFLNPAYFNTPLGTYKIKEGIRLEIVLLINEYKNYLISNNCFLNELFNYDLLNLENSTYRNIQFDKIIFCQGFANIHNPFFDDIKIIPNKGEYIIVKTKIPHQLPYTITSNGIVSPLNDNTFYVGATYEWVGEDTSTSASATKHLREVFENVCNLDYEICSQGVALRPAIQARKPIMGLHQKYPQLGMLNGMGTKGTMLAPYFAHHFSRFLLYNEPLDMQIAIKK